MGINFFKWFKNVSFKLSKNWKKKKNWKKPDKEVSKQKKVLDKEESYNDVLPFLAGMKDPVEELSDEEKKMFALMSMH